MQEVTSLTSLRWHHPQTPHSATSHTTHTVKPTDTRNTLRDKEPAERRLLNIRAAEVNALTLHVAVNLLTHLFNLSHVDAVYVERSKSVTYKGAFLCRQWFETEPLVV